MKDLSLGLICIREIEAPRYHVEILEFEGALSELLRSLLDLFNQEHFDLIYAVENLQTPEFLDAAEKIRETDVEDMVEQGAYREVFNKLNFVEFRKYPLGAEPVLSMEIKWSYLADDQRVIPLLDLECNKANPLMMRCQKIAMPEAHQLCRGEYPLDLLVIADATRLVESNEKLFAFRILVESDVVMKSPNGTPHILYRSREIELSLYFEELDEMGLKELYAYLAHAILQSKFLDELSELFREECIEYTKERYSEIVSKWLRKV